MARRLRFLPNSAIPFDRKNQPNSLSVFWLSITLWALQFTLGGISAAALGPVWDTGVFAVALAAIVTSALTPPAPRGIWANRRVGFWAALSPPWGFAFSGIEARSRTILRDGIRDRNDLHRRMPAPARPQGTDQWTKELLGAWIVAAVMFFGLVVVSAIRGEPAL